MPWCCNRRPPNKIPKTPAPNNLACEKIFRTIQNLDTSLRYGRAEELNEIRLTKLAWKRHKNFFQSSKRIFLLVKFFEIFRSNIATLESAVPVSKGWRYNTTPGPWEVLQPGRTYSAVVSYRFVDVVHLFSSGSHVLLLPHPLILQCSPSWNHGMFKRKPYQLLLVVRNYINWTMQKYIRVIPDPFW